MQPKRTAAASRLQMFDIVLVLWSKNVYPLKTINHS